MSDVGGKKLKHRREGRKKLNFLSGGAGTLFCKLWLVCRLVRLANVCAALAFSYSLYFSISFLQNSTSLSLNSFWYFGLDAKNSNERSTLCELVLLVF